MKIINLTPHDIHIYDSEGKNIIRTYPASGIVTRANSFQEVVGEVDGVPVVRSSFGKIEGLPLRERGTKYIVSFLVLRATTWKRNDLIGPDTSPDSVVRDENGQIIGVRRFQIL